MKPYFAKPTIEFDNSVAVRRDVLKHFHNRWHYHDEYELVYIIKSTGLQFTGDHIRKFSPGELTILGNRLPHNWINDDEYYNYESDLMAEAIILHVQRQFIHNDFMKLPMMKSLSLLFKDACHGILIPDVSLRAKEILLNLPQLEGLDKGLQILELFRELSETPSKCFLASNGYIENMMNHSTERLFKVYDYIANNFTGKIRLGELADIAHMTPNAFCSYFRKKTSKTIFDYITEMRIGYARKLLINSEIPIGDVALRSGFQSISLFNRQFKKSGGMTPLRYRKKYGE